MDRKKKPQLEMPVPVPHIMHLSMHSAESFDKPRGGWHEVKVETNGHK